MGLTDEEKYFFDLLGFAILRDVLPAEQVARCNEAIDEHAHLLAPHERRLEGDSRTLTSPVR